MKRFLGILVALLLVLPVLAGEAGAASKAGDNITYSYDKETQTLTFTGTGKMYDQKYIDGGDCEYLDIPWDYYSYRHVVIGEGITQIGQLCFAESRIESIQLPSTLKVIRREAFYDTPYLKSIVFPEGLTSIEFLAFSDSGLESITIPSTLEAVGKWAFSGENLKEIVLSEKATRIPDYLLYSVHGVETFVIPEGVTVIGTGAFGECVNLKSITLPSTLQEIGEDAFAGCEALTQVVIPETVTTLGSGAFSGCSGLTDITFPSTLKCIPDYAIAGCSSLTEIRIPETVTQIGKGAFERCLITQIRLPETLTKISSYLFSSCSNLESIEIPKGVTAIGDCAFNGCKKLTVVTVPQKVKSLGDGAFMDCDRLEQIHLPETMESIGEQVFRGCCSLKSVKIPYGVTEIPWAAFSGCYDLEELILPQTVKTTGSWVFSDCCSLEQMDLPEGLVEIGGKAFKDCCNLKRVTIPSTLTVWGDEVFGGCNRLEEFAVHEGCGGYTVLDGVLYSEDMSTLAAFPGAKVLPDGHFAIPEGVREIVDGAFAGRDAYLSVSFPSTMTKISEGAFYDCDGLTEIHLPDQITEIGWGAFMFCINLETVTLSPATTLIDGMAFCFCTSLKEITIPPGVTKISQDAFSDCETLERISIPVSLKSVDTAAFQYCVDLEDVYYSGSSDQKKDITGYKRIPGTWHYNCLAKPSVKLTMTDSGNPRLKWSAVSKADKYYILRSKTKSGGYEVIGSTTSTAYTDAGAGDQKYYYKVAAWDNGNSIYSGFSKVVENTVYIEAPAVTVTGSASSGKPILTWDAISNAEKYHIYRATSKSGSYERIETVTDTTFTDKSAKAGRNCYYKVKAVLGSDTSAYSNVVNRVCDLKQPKVTLKVDTASGKPKVTWEKISGAEKYYIVRATSQEGTYSKLATVTGTSYIDKSAEVGVEYFYKVKALHKKDSADSVYSEITSRICDLKKPVVTIKLSSGNPRLTWNKIEGAEKYYVYRATSKNGEYTHVKTTKTASSFTDTDVKAGKTYYYKVKAIHGNTDANSAYSAVKYIKAK